MRNFEINRNPYGIGALCNRKNIAFNEGITVLIGCNGSGKTTILNNIQSELEKDNTPCYYYNDKRDGESVKKRQLLENDIEEFSKMVTSSEGEVMVQCFGLELSKLRQFISTGEITCNLSALLASLREENSEKPNTNERWLLFDALDSGLSLDMLYDVKDVFNLIIEDGKAMGKAVYIVVAANSYALAENEHCLDVTTGTYCTFKTYEEYKTRVWDTRKRKDKRYTKSE